jgi:hypothetical protein
MAAQHKKIIMESKEDNKAPMFGSWNAWYLIVLGFLLILIIVFSLFTNYFS